MEPPPPENPSPEPVHWLFQANPALWPVRDLVEEGRVENWRVAQHRADMRRGQEGALWVSGPDGGVLALFVLEEEPVFGKGDQGPDLPEQHWVRIRFTRRLEPPIGVQEIKADPVLKGMTVIRMPRLTNYRLSDAEWKVLKTRIEGTTPAAGEPIGPDRIPVLARQVEGLVRAQALEHLRSMDPKLFEQLVGRLLRHMGYDDVKVTGYSGDGGIDATAVMNREPLRGLRLYVQAKRWKAAVQAPTVQQLRGALGPGHLGMIVTTSYFTPGARAEATRGEGKAVVLIEGAKLVDLLIQYSDDGSLGFRVDRVPVLYFDPERLDSSQEGPSGDASTPGENSEPSVESAGD